MFWQRKNERLETRLNTVIETSERTRQSLDARPRKVLVDTSYVQPLDDLGSEHPTGQHAPYPAQPTNVPDTDSGHPDDTPVDLHYRHAADDAEQPEAVDGDYAPHETDPGEAHVSDSGQRDEPASDHDEISTEVTAVGSSTDELDTEEQRELAGR